MKVQSLLTYREEVLTSDYPYGAGHYVSLPAMGM